jgi:UDP-2,3-diacylglucosamine hydrolase
MSKAQNKAEYQTAVNQDAVAACLLEHDADRMIHGHTHRPDTYRFDLRGRGRERIVLPDWRTCGLYLEMSETGCRVLEIKEN